MLFDYRKEVLRTCPNFEKDLLRDQLSLAGLGIAGEAGECADLIKKIIHHGKGIEKGALIKEMGDVYWYLEYLCAILGTTAEDVQKANVEKLRKRYPDGFNFEAANNRTS